MKKNMREKTGFTLFGRLCVLAMICIPGITSALADDIKAELDWARRVELGTPVKGVVQHIMAQPGQRIAKNEVLLQLDQRGFKSRVAGLKAQVAHLKAELAEARREQERAMELYDRTVLSDHELQVAKNNFIAAEARYQKGRSELVQAELDLEYSSIRAPYDAVIVSRLAEVGQTVVPDLQPVVLFVVADARHMLAKGRVTANEIAKLSLGEEALVKFDSEEYKGLIINFGLEPSIENKTTDRRYFVNVEFPIQSQASYVGQSVKIILP
jgi:multidrug efflux system membrane fusion protein